MHDARRIVRGALIGLSFAASTRAEISGQSYRKMQDAASEALDVRVTRVVVEPQQDGRLVSVSAKVIDVRRTETKRKPGDTIRIRYVTAPEHRPPVVGISPVRVPHAGETFVAYLKADGKLYRPAAYDASFVESPTNDDGAASRPGP